MKPEYVTGWFDDPYQWAGHAPSLATAAISVYEPENLRWETGLLDAKGNKLFRIKRRPTMGFWPAKS